MNKVFSFRRSWVSWSWIWSMRQKSLSAKDWPKIWSMMNMMKETNGCWSLNLNMYCTGDWDVTHCCKYYMSLAIRHHSNSWEINQLIYWMILYGKGCLDTALMIKAWLYLQSPHVITRNMGRERKKTIKVFDTHVQERRPEKIPEWAESQRKS